MATSTGTWSSVGSTEDDCYCTDACSFTYEMCDLAVEALANDELGQLEVKFKKPKSNASMKTPEIPDLAEWNDDTVDPPRDSIKVSYPNLQVQSWSFAVGDGSHQIASLIPKGLITKLEEQ